MAYLERGQLAKMRLKNLGHNLLISDKASIHSINRIKKGAILELVTFPFYLELKKGLKVGRMSVWHVFHLYWYWKPFAYLS
jgi:hypothetical protein